MQNNGIVKIEKILNIKTGIPELIQQGLKQYKSAKIIKAAELYIEAYDTLLMQQEFLNQIIVNSHLYLTNNLFSIYENCILLCISQITMFLKNDYLVKFLPFAAVSECLEFEEEKFVQILEEYSKTTAEQYFAEFYNVSFPKAKELLQHREDLYMYIISLNRQLAFDRKSAIIKRELKYKITGTY